MRIIKLINIVATRIKRRMRVFFLRNWQIIFIPPLVILALVFSVRATTCGYRSKRYQSEAKFALSKAYAFQKDHFDKYGSYNFDPADWVVDREVGESRYIVGIAYACASKEAKKYFFYPANSELSPSLLKRLPEAVDFLINARRLNECPDPKHGFEVFAVGEIVDARPLDIWVINDTKEVRNLQVGF